MPTITRSALVDTIRNRRGAFPITLVAETVPAMNKTDNPYYGQVKKVSRVNGFCGADYENGVLRRRFAEGTYEPWEALPRKWGQRVMRDGGSLTGLVHHVKDGVEKWYLELFVNKSIQHEYRIDGAAIDAGLIHPFLRDRKDGERQGLDKPIIVRDYSIDNVRQVTMDGTTYDVVDG